MEVSTLLKDEVRELADQAVQRGSVIAFQSTLAAAAQVVRDALSHEETVGKASLSLAHQDTLGEMTEQLRVVCDSLESSLDRQGRCLLPDGAEDRPAFRFPRRMPRRDMPPRRPAWSHSLFDAIETLERGASCMDALTSGQPADAPSRALGSATAALLRDHLARLSAEAERLAGSSEARAA